MLRTWPIGNIAAGGRSIMLFLCCSRLCRRLSRVAMPPKALIRRTASGRHAGTVVRAELEGTGPRLLRCKRHDRKFRGHEHDLQHEVALEVSGRRLALCRFHAGVMRSSILPAAQLAEDACATK